MAATLEEPASEAGSELGGVLGPPLYLGAAVLAAVLVIAHLSAPRLRRMLTPHASVVRSFGGGMAAAYVFLHLLPELDVGHELLGALIYVLPLLGFVVHYLVKHRLHVLAQSKAEVSGESFWTELINLAFYNLLIVYVAPQLEMELGLASVAIFTAMTLHLIQSDYGFGLEYPRRFDQVGRFVLAFASLTAYAILVVRQQLNETVADMLTAFLAGSVLFRVFRDEVPDQAKSRITWFIGGIIVFSALASVGI